MTHSTDLLWSCEPSDQAAFRQAAIAKSAYFRAQQRGFAPGHELEDWLAAEHEATHAKHDLVKLGNRADPGPVAAGRKPQN